jgi:hypothetical protein
VTLRTHDLPEFFGYSGGKIKAKSDAAFRTLIARFVAFYRESLFNPHWGEQAKLGSDNVLEISMVSQGLDGDENRRVWQPFIDWVKASNDYTVSDIFQGATPARHWWDVAARKKRGSDAMISDERPNMPEPHAFWRGDRSRSVRFSTGTTRVAAGASPCARSARRISPALSRRAAREVGLLQQGLAGAPAQVLAAAKDAATNPWFWIPSSGHHRRRGPAIGARAFGAGRGGGPEGCRRSTSRRQSRRIAPDSVPTSLKAASSTCLAAGVLEATIRASGRENYDGLFFVHPASEARVGTDGFTPAPKC